ISHVFSKGGTAGLFSIARASIPSPKNFSHDVGRIVRSSFSLVRIYASLVFGLKLPPVYPSNRERNSPSKRIHPGSAWLSSVEGDNGSGAGGAVCPTRPPAVKNIAESRRTDEWRPR